MLCLPGRTLGMVKRPFSSVFACPTPWMITSTPGNGAWDWASTTLPETDPAGSCDKAPAVKGAIKEIVASKNRVGLGIAPSLCDESGFIFSASQQNITSVKKPHERRHVLLFLLR